MYGRLILVLISSIILLSCTPEGNPPAANDGRMSYSTTSDSADHYYRLGWRQIMAEGRYGQSEVSYRKALEHDPDFLLAKATLGRLTLDTLERLRLEQELNEAGENLPAEERDLLGLYTDLVRFTNLRERNPAAARLMIKDVLLSGETILGRLAHRYPAEAELQSEFVEFVQSNHGPQAGLDSLVAFDNKDSYPFLQGFAAHLNAELDRFKEALYLARAVENSLKDDPTAPKAPAVYADIYFAMDSLQTAYKYALKATQLDPRNLDASRLLTRIEQGLEEQ